MKSSTTQGFTLVELLIALSIFAIMTVMAYGGLDSVLKTRAHIEKAANELQQIQRLFLFIQQDLYHASPKFSRNQFGDIQASFVGGRNAQDLMQFVRTISPQEGQFPFLTISYQIEEGEINRYLWPANGQLSFIHGQKMRLAQNIEAIDVQFYYQRWHNLWPPLPNNANKAPPELPIGIQITLETKRWGLITRVMALQ